MSSPRFGSGRTMECEAWKRRVYAEEKALRDSNGGTLQRLDDSPSPGRGRTAPSQPRNDAPSTKRKIVGVTQRMGVLEQALQEGAMSRAAVTSELKDMRDVLTSLIATDRGSGAARRPPPSTSYNSSSSWSSSVPTSPDYRSA